MQMSYIVSPAHVFYGGIQPQTALPICRHILLPAQRRRFLGFGRMLEQQMDHGTHFTDAVLFKPFLMMPTIMHSCASVLPTTSSSIALAALPSCADSCKMQGICSLT